MSKKFRVGIMASSYEFSSWSADCIAYLQEIPELEISLVVLEGQRRLAAPARPIPSWRRLVLALKDGSLLAKLLDRVNWLARKTLWPRYRQWQLDKRRVPSALAVDLKPQLQGIDTLKCDTLAKGRFAEIFRDEDVERIRSYNLDVLLKFGFNIVHGAVLQAATHGVWSYHHDDHLHYRGGPPGFWEVFQDAPWTGAMLQRINEKLDDGLVLHKEFFRTRRDSYSHNIDRLWRGSSCWPALQCLQLLAGLPLGAGEDQTRSAAPIYKAPTNGQMISMLTRLASRKATSRLKPPGGQLQEHWGIGVTATTPGQLVDGDPVRPHTWLCSEEGSFCADPFVLSHQKRDYLFFERFDYSTERGSLAVTSTLDWKDFAPVEIVLEGSDQHYSYPMVFEADGAIYCLPEQSSQKQIALYELCDFPKGWRRAGCLLDNFAGLDPTIFFDGELWWLLVGGAELSVDHLYAFYSPSLHGNWKPHAANPIVSTQARRSRPAGRIFQHGGKFYRPAQYGNRYYGYGLLVYRVDELTPLTYRESLVKVCVPQPSWVFADGLHHLDGCARATVFDAKNHFSGRPPKIPDRATVRLRLA